MLFASRMAIWLSTVLRNSTRCAVLRLLDGVGGDLHGVGGEGESVESRACISRASGRIGPGSNMCGMAFGIVCTVFGFVQYHIPALVSMLRVGWSGMNVGDALVRYISNVFPREPPQNYYPFHLHSW